MIEELTRIKGWLNTFQDTSPNYRFYIVGGILRDGTRTTYDDSSPAEIMIDSTVQKWLLNGTKDFLENLLDFDIVNINDVDEASESVKRYLELDSLSQLDQWKQFIENGNGIPNARDCINNEDFKPKCMLAKLSYQNEDVYFIKVISDSVLLKTRKVLKYFEARDGYVIDENRDRRLFLDDQWDGIIYNNSVILFNENKILTLFKYYEKFREAAANVISQLEQVNFLAGTSDLNTFIQSTVSLQKKLAKASAYDIDRISTERIGELINQGMINLTLNTEGKIECTTKEEAKVVIDVLLDNFVSSLITDEKYKVYNKSKLQNQY